MAGIAQISHDASGNPFWAGNALSLSGSASQAGGATPVVLGNLTAGTGPGDTPAVIDVRTLTIAVFNNATSQTIIGLTLTTTGTVGTASATITYPIQFDVTGAPISITSGNVQTFLVPLEFGYFATLTLAPTFAAAPSAGTVQTLVTAQGSASPLVVMRHPPVIATPLTIPTGSAAGAQVYIDLSGIWVNSLARSFYVRDVSGASTSWGLVTGNNTTDFAVIRSWSTDGDQNAWFGPATCGGSDAIPAVGSSITINLIITPGSTVTVGPGPYVVTMYQQPY